MIDGLDRKVHVQIGPVEMVRMREFDVAQLADRNVSKPRKVLECKKPLSLAKQEPESMLRNVRDLNDRSGLSTRCGFHPHAPEPAGERSQGAADPGPREEVASKPAFSQHRRAHAQSLPHRGAERDEVAPDRGHHTRGVGRTPYRGARRLWASVSIGLLSALTRVGEVPRRDTPRTAQPHSDPEMNRFRPPDKSSRSRQRDP